ncbi:MAG TPA: hypothetical protein PK014_01725 [Thermoanaerobaculia bacterium]|nr:hypothetical protein [Thermoanaerobaculia bacterium]HUM28588.1 hypothetical protein [Thermoanaerobaculia bacterium]HXK66804.1 hypothetical protein [Thermoanaerobaculia bacterium]
MEYDKEPDFIVCSECETPSYNFEFKDGRILVAFCSECGNDEADQFYIPAD